jgi:hypothetical protein
VGGDNIAFAGKVWYGHDELVSGTGRVCAYGFERDSSIEMEIVNSGWRNKYLGNDILQPLYNNSFVKFKTNVYSELLVLVNMRFVMSSHERAGCV